MASCFECYCFPKLLDRSVPVNSGRTRELSHTHTETTSVGHIYKKEKNASNLLQAKSWPAAWKTFTLHAMCSVVVVEFKLCLINNSRLSVLVETLKSNFAVEKIFRFLFLVFKLRKFSTTGLRILRLGVRLMHIQVV